jgi:dihydroorotase
MGTGVLLPIFVMSIELLQQVRLLDPVSQTDRSTDILIQDGQVQAIAETLANYPAEAIVQDGRGLVLAPGLIDLYSTSGEPGHEDRETLKSLATGAIAGGFTRLTVLPTTQPPVDNPSAVAWLQHQWQALPNPKPILHNWGALTQATKGDQMTELGELATSGIAGFADGKPMPNLLLVRRVLEYARSLGKPIALWPIDPELMGNGVMREGAQSILFGLPGIPAYAETAALAALLECIAEISTPVHLMRISTARSVALIQSAKEQGVPITASVSWMHLVLNSEAVASYDPNLRLDPPLGNPTDQAALIQGLQTGVLDAIAIDHTPHTYEEKTVAFAEAPAGAIGLELALPILWQTLVEQSGWQPLHLLTCLSTRPAQCLQQPPAAIAPGQPAEMILFDPQKSWTATPATLHSQANNTPWLDKPITGKVLRVWCSAAC